MSSGYNITEERMYHTPYAHSNLLPMLLMSLAVQRHTPITKKELRPEYDYVIVGSGPGGSVVASRLSEVPCVDVLLLEAGKSAPLQSDIPGIARSFIMSDLDWKYRTAPQKNCGIGLRNNQVQWPSGKTVGGSSVINAMLFVKGNRHIYDEWAAQGATGWSYDDVSPYLKKLENLLDSSDGDPGYHGFAGPVSEQRPNYLPEFKEAVFKAAENMGYPIRDSNGEFQRGFFNHTLKSRGGQRCSSAKAYLVPAENRTNLDIVEQAFVKRVLIEDGVAKGVEVDFGNQTYQIKARKEVIVSAGTVNTAQLLMLSGIGPKEHLDEMKIPLIADLPVGMNLQDHCGALYAYTISDSIQRFEEKLSDPDNIHRYIDNREGPLCNSEFVTSMAFLTNDRKAPPDAVPDHELYFVEGLPYVAKKQNNVKREGYESYFGPYEKKPQVWCISQILHPKSRGTVRLSSNDPYDPPIIDPNYYDDPQDLTDVAEGLKECDDIMSSEPLKKLEVKPFDTPYGACDALLLDRDAFFRCVATNVVVTLNHEVGTCKMGDPKDNTTVVDPQLRVRGVKGLRVVDASVMPIVPTGNTNIPTTMVAEKASDIIKESIDCN